MSVIEKLELLRARADTAHKYADVSAAYEACGIVAEIGPAIRQDMIDARRYRWLKGQLNDKERGEWDFTIDLQTANTNKDSE